MFRQIVTFTALLLINCGASAYADNSISVGSVTTVRGDFLLVPIHVSNDVPITGIILPLEIRPESLQFVSPTGFWKVDVGRRGRVLASPLGNASQNWPPAEEFKARFLAPASANYCSGPISATYDSVVAATANPRALLYIVKAAGSDTAAVPNSMSAGSDPSGFVNASMDVIFDVSGLTGRFIIDTCCVGPGHHLEFTDVAGQSVAPSFTSGELLILTATEAAAQFGNSVIVESKSVHVGQTSVEIGVFINNAIHLTGYVLPLEIREITPGAYPAANFSFLQNPAGRLRASPLGAQLGGYWPSASVTTTRYPLPAAGSTGPCPRPGDSSTSWRTSSADIDFISPDALYQATVSMGDGNIGDKISLDAGADPEGTGNASNLIRFDVSMIEGQFEIDTTCVTPVNHLLFVDLNTAPVIPAFTKGIITIGPCACPCAADPICDSVTDVVDVAAAIDVAFRGVPQTQDSTCIVARTDVNADGSTDIVDVVRIVYVTFYGQAPSTYFVDPCE